MVHNPLGASNMFCLNKFIFTGFCCFGCYYSARSTSSTFSVIYVLFSGLVKFLSCTLLVFQLLLNVKKHLRIWTMNHAFSCFFKA